MESVDEIKRRLRPIFEKEPIVKATLYRCRFIRKSEIKTGSQKQQTIDREGITLYERKVAQGN